MKQPIITNDGVDCNVKVTALPNPKGPGKIFFQSATPPADAFIINGSAILTVTTVACDGVKVDDCGFPWDQ